MKRQIANPSTFFVILAAFMLLAVQGMSYGQMVSIDPASVESPAAGEQLTLNINITGGMNVAGYQVTVTFDPTALSYVSSEQGDYFSSVFPAPPVVTDNSVGVGGAGLDISTGSVVTANGDGTLATVTFTVIEAKDSTIGLTDVQIADATTGAAVPGVTVQGGMVTGPAPEMMEPAAPMEAAIDRFSAAAGTLMVRDDSGALPGPNEPINFDQPPFITQGLGPSGQVVQYYNFDVQPVAPAPIWVLFREGEDDPAQSPVIDVIPGDEGYNDFWGMTKVTVPADYEANSVTSLAGITAAGYAMENTGVIINCPVVPKGSTAMLRGGGESNGLHAGWYKDMVVYYFTFEEKMLSGATVPLSPIYVTFNANGMPPSGFVMEEGTMQTHNVVATIPSDDGYSPLWLVSVYDNADFDSVSDLASAEAANILAAGVATVNCPVVSVEAMEMPPVEPPVEPEPTVEPTHMFEMALAPGLNMISLPLMPAESYTASSFADMIDATVVIQLDTAMQQFVGFTADQEGDGFAIEGGKGYIVNVPGGGMVTFTGTAWGNTVEDAAAAPSVQLPSAAWAFVVSGDLLETEAGVSYTVVAKNHRTGEVATRLISSEHKEFNAVWADLTRKSVIEAGDTLEVTLIDQWDNIVSGPFTHKVGIEDLRNAYLSLALTVGDVHPAETILGQNFPNPFNPETWIPYQLEKSADVSLQIYDTSGRIVRTIDLGFKSQGFYMTRSTAAYWDGRNNMGEQVASGVYFYSLQTPDFSATRKMLILK